MMGYFGECKWRGWTRLQVLTLLILVGMVNSMDVSTTLSSNHKEPTDSIKSIDLKMEARNDEMSKIIEIPETTKVHPVYSESRANLETKLSANPSGAWKSVIKTSSKDSYLDALNHSHLKTYQPDVSYNANNKKLLRRKYETPVYSPTSLNIEISKEPKTYVTPTTDTFVPAPKESFSLPINEATDFNEQNQYGTLENNNDYEITSYNYGTPSQSYAPSQIYYENSQPTYETPSQSYGAAVNNAYGPPKQSYGTPPQHQGETRAHEVTSSSGYQFPNLIELPSLSSIGLAWPLAIKLNAFTVAKIILKLVIFKMIVKFIAVMCLLLFIPKLKAKKEGKDDDYEDDDDRRSAISEDLRTQKLNVLTANVLESIEKYETKNGAVEDDDKCSSFSCRLRRLIGTGDTWDDYFKLFSSYAAEEEEEEAEEAEEDEEDEKIDKPTKKNTTETKT